MDVFSSKRIRALTHTCGGQNGRADAGGLACRPAASCPDSPRCRSANASKAPEWRGSPGGDGCAEMSDDLKENMSFRRKCCKRKIWQLVNELQMFYLHCGPCSAGKRGTYEDRCLLSLLSCHKHDSLCLRADSRVSRFIAYVNHSYINFPCQLV